MFTTVRYVDILLKLLLQPLICYRYESWLDAKLCHTLLTAHHWLELNVKMRLMGFKGKAEIKPLNEAKAIELGSEILGETLIFGVAAATIIAEYYRSLRNERKKEDKQNDTLAMLVAKVSDLELQMQQQSSELRELRRGSYYQSNNMTSKSKTATPPLKVYVNENSTSNSVGNFDLSKSNPPNTNTQENSRQSQSGFSFFSWFFNDDSTKSDRSVDERSDSTDNKQPSTNNKSIDYKK